jgi:DNA-binding MarR family transcriptional regulator
MGTQEINAQLVDQSVSLGSLITDITRGIVGELGLTESQANLLWLVDPEADPVPLKKLAVRLQCDPSNVTLLSDKLQEKGLAKRVPHPQDGRVRTLVLTKAGVRARKRMLSAAYDRSPFATLDEREQRQLHRLLAKVLVAPQAVGKVG